MAGKLSPTAQTRVALYESFMPHVARLNSLVEQFAVARGTRDELKPSLKRAASQTKIRFMNSGLDQLAQQCSSIELAAGRRGNPAQLARLLRDLVGSLRSQLDLEIRTTIREDVETAAREAKNEREEETQA